MVINTDKKEPKRYVIQQRVLIGVKNGSKFFSKSGWFKKAIMPEWSEWKEVYSYSSFSLKNGVIRRVLENFESKTKDIDKDIEYRVIKKEDGDNKVQTSV